MITNFLYLSPLCPEEVNRKLWDKKIKLYQTVQKYHRLLAHGISANSCKVTALSSTWVPKKLRLYFDGDVTYKYVSPFKIPLIRQSVMALLTFFITLEWCLAHKDRAIITDALGFTVSASGLLAAKITKTPIIGIVTDLPEFLVDGKNSVYTSLTQGILSSFSGYVFLTVHMNKINLKNKPYIVIEGQVEKPPVINEIKYKPKVCMYTGSILEKYGIIKLVEAFALANPNGWELHIYGDGDTKEYLQSLSDKQIQYKGTVPNYKIVEAQMQATLLVNPRPTCDEYTAYSFPSKNMEYMASGTPLLSTKLEGMPADHYPYVYFFDDETIEGMARTITDISNKSSDELAAFGANARSFVQSNKNYIIQSKKIIEMTKLI